MPVNILELYNQRRIPTLVAVKFSPVTSWWGLLVRSSQVRLQFWIFPMVTICWESLYILQPSPSPAFVPYIVTRLASWLLTEGHYINKSLCLLYPKSLSDGFQASKLAGMLFLMASVVLMLRFLSQYFHLCLWCFLWLRPRGLDSWTVPMDWTCKPSTRIGLVDRPQGLDLWTVPEDWTCGPWQRIGLVDRPCLEP